MSFLSLIRLLPLLYISLLPSSSASSDVLLLHIPPRVPSTASSPIDPSFPGFAFEQASFYNYSFSAPGVPNVFSRNLIASVFNRTGGTPILRVGGTSGDKGHYNASQDDVVNRPATEGGPAFNPPLLSVGPSFFDAFRSFPGAQYTFMVPLFQRDLNNTLAWTARGLSVIGPALGALEIGNEPNFYPWYNNTAYVDEFNLFAAALSAAFPAQLDHRPVYQALDIAWGGATATSVTDALSAGLNSTGRVRQVAFHLYQTSDQPDSGLGYLQSVIANHTAIVANMAVFAPNIRALAGTDTPLILSEVGVSLGSADLNQRNVLATALWTADYQLHALALGVRRVNNQQIITSGFQMWEPVPSASGGNPLSPLVRANFYAQPFVADFIGRASSNGRTRVLELETGSDTLAAYAVYENARPARVAIVNLLLWTPQNGSRPCTQVQFSGLLPLSSSSSWRGGRGGGGGGSRDWQPRVASLTAPEGAFANDTLTYDGLRWSFESQGRGVPVGRDGGDGEEGLRARAWSKGGNVGMEMCVPATSAVLVDLTREG